MPRARWTVQEELLRLVRPPTHHRPPPVSERIAPLLAEVARTHAGRPAAEVVPALEAVVTTAGATPDLRALEEFAREIEAGGNPFD